MRLSKKSDKCQKMSSINIIKRGKEGWKIITTVFQPDMPWEGMWKIMSTRKKMIIVCVIIIVIVVATGMIFRSKKDNERADVKIPILLYHNFVTTVPESDPDNFNYINTPQSFEENVKTLIENGYTIMSMKELALI